MAQSNVVLLANARSVRERAEKARRLSRGIVDAQAIAQLQKYAEELERQAVELERLAAELGQTVHRTWQLTREVNDAVGTVQQTVDQMNSKKKK